MTLPRHPDVRVLASTPIASGRVFEVLRESVELPSGLRQDLLLVDHPGAVVILAEDREGRVAVVRQYRHAIGQWLVELPAGRVERGEDRLVAAQRELEEEAGLRARNWTSLGCFFPAPGFCSEQIEIFWARDLELVGAQRRALDDDEELAASWLTLERARVELSSDAKSAIALARRAEASSA
jgi:ADP-ribose pyrophosphatase